MGYATARGTTNTIRHNNVSEYPKQGEWKKPDTKNTL